MRCVKFVGDGKATCFAILCWHGDGRIVDEGFYQKRDLAIRERRALAQMYSMDVESGYRGNIENVVYTVNEVVIPKGFTINLDIGGRHERNS